tara:strand:- start:253 stop:534 length:282 start_codon:yes stop_codon:yes gene_type:complete
VGPITQTGEVITRHWQEILVIAFFIWGQSKSGSLRYERELRVRQMYRYEQCRDVFPKDKLYMWPTHTFNLQTGTYELQVLEGEELSLEKALKR